MYAQAAQVHSASDMSRAITEREPTSTRRGRFILPFSTALLTASILASTETWSGWTLASAVVFLLCAGYSVLARSSLSQRMSSAVAGTLSLSMVVNGLGVLLNVFDLPVSSSTSAVGSSVGLLYSVLPMAVLCIIAGAVTLVYSLKDVIQDASSR